MFARECLCSVCVCACVCVCSTYKCGSLKQLLPSALTNHLPPFLCSTLCVPAVRKRLMEDDTMRRKGWLSVKPITLRYVESMTPM